MIIELRVPVFVKDKAITVSADRLSSSGVSKSGVAFSIWLFDLRKKRGAVGEVGLL